MLNAFNFSKMPNAVLHIFFPSRFNEVIYGVLFISAAVPREWLSTCFSFVRMPREVYTMRSPKFEVWNKIHFLAHRVKKPTDYELHVHSIFFKEPSEHAVQPSSL